MLLKQQPNFMIALAAQFDVLISVLMFRGCTDTAERGEWTI